MEKSRYADCFKAPVITIRAKNCLETQERRSWIKSYENAQQRRNLNSPDIDVARFNAIRENNDKVFRP